MSWEGCEKRVIVASRRLVCALVPRVLVFPLFPEFMISRVNLGDMTKQKEREKRKRWRSCRVYSHFEVLLTATVELDCDDNRIYNIVVWWPDITCTISTSVSAGFLWMF